MKLFHVQDGDRPMYVVAPDWGSAISRWGRQIRAENEDVELSSEDLEPAGIAFVADWNDGAFPELLLPEPSPESPTLAGLRAEEPKPLETPVLCAYKGCSRRRCHGWTFCRECLERPQWSPDFEEKPGDAAATTEGPFPCPNCGKDTVRRSDTKDLLCCATCQWSGGLAQQASDPDFEVKGT